MPPKEDNKDSSDVIKKNTCNVTVSYSCWTDSVLARHTLQRYIYIYRNILSILYCNNINEWIIKI